MVPAVVGAGLAFGGLGAVHRVTCGRHPCPSGERPFPDRHPAPTRAASSGCAGGGHVGADAQEQLAALGLDPARGLEVCLGGGHGVEQHEAEPGLEEPLGVGVDE